MLQICTYKCNADRLHVDVTVARLTNRAYTLDNTAYCSLFEVVDCNVKIRVLLPTFVFFELRHFRILTKELVSIHILYAFEMHAAFILHSFIHSFIHFETRLH
jgi:hypothetical protein